MVEVTVHHLIREDEFVRQCPYCKRELTLENSEKWYSEFHCEIHYKTFKCNCGKDLRIKVNFHGSGHDSWNKKSNKTIDEKINEVSGYKLVGAK